MPYSVNNRPVLMSESIRGTKKIWVYSSTDPLSAVRVAGYFSDGASLGMKKGDIIFVIDSDASPITLGICIVSNVSNAGVVDLSDGTAVTATNTD